ncbi:polymorphic toxin-type HINT domain-containing protein [Xanthovirga aplysinae]|uniref:polymorphic toxin-type HINT domain-containing protein n=1 Tax=Xanthovirga aplysinae TaxID=2529853 RepID=UPI0012BBB1F9|nr:polymorphic toxin-type HINT domain-containing protein [Xanthovirga aplysinae]MTI30878.1 DUF4280 domain-containing protein [Xanthovirga aplysinae]
MPHDLEYVTKGAVMLCNQGAAPVKFNPSFNSHIKINHCLVSTEADKIPNVNVLPFGVCAKTGNPCVPALLQWQDTYKVKVKGQQTLLFKSKINCGTGGEVEFLTSGQIPVSDADLAEMTAANQEVVPEEEEEESGGWGWLDLVEMVPVVGSAVGAIREASKGNWGMAALNVGFFVMDVAGLFTGGATTAAATTAKASIKAGVKATVKGAAKKAAKAAGKTALKAGTKTLSKQGAKALAKGLAKKVDDFAIKHAKICVFACFPEGTPVHTENGIRPIEQLQKGEKVWAWNEETGEVSLREIADTMQRTADATLELSFENGQLETTAEHPFFTKKGWKEAGDLEVGDKVRNLQGVWLLVKAIDFRYESKKVYNFEVTDFHTYFVGEHGFLVHNSQVCVKGTVKKVASLIGKHIDELKEAPEGYAFFYKNAKKKIRRVDATDKRYKRLTVDDDGIIKEYKGPQRISKPGQLRKNLGDPPGPNHQAHHLVPDNVVRKHDLYQELLKRKKGLYDIDKKSNGIYLAEETGGRVAGKSDMFPIHNGSHSTYDDEILNRIDRVLEESNIDVFDLGNVSDSGLKKLADEVEKQALNLIKEWKDLNGLKLF